MAIPHLWSHPSPPFTLGGAWFYSCIRDMHIQNHIYFLFVQPTNVLYTFDWGMAWECILITYYVYN